MPSKPVVEPVGVLKERRDRVLPSNVVYSLMDDEFYAGLEGKPRVSFVAQCDWALDNIGRLKALAARYRKHEETLPLIRELLGRAPGAKAVSALLEMLYDPKLGEKYRAIVSKADDDGGEEAHRGRTGQKRFGVIEALKDVGQPLPPWLNQFGFLEETR